jgi:putative tryptophan/tyrosine transport system substrate-binding protein
MRRRQVIALFAGAAFVWPLVVRAQQAAKTARIGFLSSGSLGSPDGWAFLAAFREGLHELGHVEVRDFVIEQRAAEGKFERLADLATELVRLPVDLIVAGATPATRAAQQATTTIPIVVIAMGDPVRDGLVASLGLPGENITGTTFLGPELVPKRLALLKELLPGMSRIGVLWHRDAFSERTTSAMLKETAEAAESLGLQLQLVEVQRADEFDDAFSAMAGARVEALFQFPSTMLFGERRRLVELAATHRLPAMFNEREFVELGGLIAYGTSIAALRRRTATYVDKILKGAKPSDLPIEQPTSSSSSSISRRRKPLALPCRRPFSPVPTR